MTFAKDHKNNQSTAEDDGNVKFIDAPRVIGGRAWPP